MSDDHADASPSSSAIWIKCPASVTKARGRARKASAYTREGTAAHEVAERLIHGLEPPDEIVVEGEAVEIDDEMVEHVEIYVSYVEKLRQDADLFLTETRVHVTGLPEPVHGTADVIAYSRAQRTIEIPDLKYGKGVPVKVDGNTQTRIYALGAINVLGPFEPVDTVVMTIVQPRLVKSAPQQEKLSVQELFDWERDVLTPAAQRIADDDQTETPGEHCRFCVRAGECHALAGLAQSAAKLVFAKTGDLDAHGLSNDELSAILDKAEIIVAWVGKVRAEASSRMDTGQKVPGWKLVAKRAMRKWANPEDALGALVALGAPYDAITKIVTVAAAERAMKAAKIDPKGISPLVVKESSGSTLVRDEDEREGLATDAKSVFRRAS